MSRQDNRCSITQLIVITTKQPTKKHIKKKRSGRPARTGAGALNRWQYFIYQ
jgi:hypothetical protein